MAPVPVGNWIYLFLLAAALLECHPVMAVTVPSGAAANNGRAAAAASAMVVRPAIRSGFRQFSQKAASRRLQQSQKQFSSLKSSVGNVVTNNPSDATQQQHERALQLALELILEALGGGVGGYLLGTTLESTKRFYKCLFTSGKTVARAMTTTTTTHLQDILPYSYASRFTQEALTIHRVGGKWAKEWALVAALFSGCRIAIQVLTTANHHHDDTTCSLSSSVDDIDAWNAIGGSALAGAILAATSASPKRILRLPLVAMTREALLYGGTMFLLYPSLWWRKPLLQQLLCFLENKLPPLC